MLGIQLPPAPVNPGAPWKHPLLVQTPLTGPGAGVLIQSGLSPPQPPAGFHPAIFANPIWWQTAPELLSGVLGAGRPELPFDGFLTRLCIKCETLVQCEEYYRRVTNYRGNETQSDLQRWETSYASSCTCRKKLGVGPFAGEDILCKPHRERQWKELVAARDERDRFLRGVENRAPPARKKLISASAATLQNRVNAPGWWRACRCGDEVGHAIGRIPRALMCMGCEGYVVLAPLVVPLGQTAIWRLARFKRELLLAGDLSVPRRVTENGPSPELPFAFTTSCASAAGNRQTYETHRSAILSHIINDAAIIPITITDLNFSNAILLLGVLHSCGQLPSFTVTLDANRVPILPARRLDVFHYTTATAFPTSLAKANAFQKFARSITPKGNLHASHWAVEYQSLKVLEKFSLKVGMVEEKMGYHVACVVRAVRTVLDEDLRRRHEQMLAKGRELEEDVVEDDDEDGGDGDGE
ncbi:hypothetical protein CLAFUW4_03708 [Fulvia fulva]|uniref:Uncharacterized protein n=1 Tax=Passalora fulva TaxID=5499 RepID=A0A9Q8P5C0_PASFU|nr:uncharacterized protein CLAFUR5_03685 [Fulvia fulva]UJO13769.1 hypothetical protein CLAFUR5_03685 [Fulvia fulva]WPV10911.1 hypothetical protein CLAFUW4_03708 [Fulvia fulva]